MSGTACKYTTTEAVLNKEWPNIKEKSKLSFRSYDFNILTHNAKQTDDSLKFTIKHQDASLFFGSKYDVFLVLTIPNENPEKSLHITKKIPKDENSFLQNKLKFTVPFDCSKITPDSGFIPTGSITMRIYFYILIDDDEDTEDEPEEEFVPGIYKNEKCWRILNFSKLENYKSSDFSFHEYSFHYEIDKIEADQPFKFKFICDSVGKLKSKLKILFLILNVGGCPTVTVKKQIEEAKKGDELIIEFAKTFKEITAPENGFNVKNSVYISIVSKTCEYKNSNELEYTPVNHSKEETGFVGLVNQGATCYMNSMLQSLFHLSAFRKLVYELPTTGKENPKKSIPLNLQRLFGELQLSDNPCKTEDLTVSFGWDFSRTIVQHDTQEFCRVLLNNLEEKLKDNEELKDGVAKIFRGQSKSYIRCINVEFESSRVEDFYDLTMDVEGCSNLEESFKKFTESEKMEGDNRYDTGDPNLGKQDAMMGEEFIKFPPVLQLHLRRFNYDYFTDRMVKINSRFEFPEEIDLSQFLAKSDNTPNVYELYGVLVHSGTVSHGHYYAFLRTSLGPQWYQFNDSTVSKASKESAIDNNFGGSNSSISTSSYSYEKSYSAYILIYVRKDDAKWIFENISDEEIPDHIRQFIKNPESFKYVEEKTSKKEVEEEKEKEVKLVVTPEEAIVSNIMKGRAGFIDSSLSKDVLISSKMSKKDIYIKVAEAFNLPVDEIRLWSINSNSPSYLFYRSDTQGTFATSQSSLFLQHKEAKEEVNISYNNMNIFLKFFSTSLELPLQYIGSVIMDSTKATDEDIIGEVNDRLGLPKGTSLDVYQELPSGKINLLKITAGKPLKLKDHKISNGSSLIFQISKDQASLDAPPVPHYDFKKPEPGEGKEEEGEEEECPVYSFKKAVETVPDYFDNLSSNLVKISLFDYFYFLEPICILEVPYKMETSALKKFIIDSLKIEYDEKSDIFSLYKSYFSHSYPNTSKVNEAVSTDIEKIFTMIRSGHEEGVLYIKLVKGVTTEQLKEKAVINVQFSEDSIHVSKRFFISLPKPFKYEDLVKEITKELNLDVGPNRLRIFSMEPKRVGEILNKSSFLSSSLNCVHVDLIPEDQANLSDNEQVVRFFVARADTTSDAIITGTVFSLKVNVNDTFSAIRENIEKICSIEEEKVKKTHFFIGKENTRIISKNALNDEDKLDKIQVGNNVFIILPSKNSKISKRRKEESLKLDN